MDWPKFAQRLLLNDGRIDEQETKLLRRAVLLDRLVDKEEAAFLVALKRQAVAVHPSYDVFLFDVLRRAVLSDGVVTDTEAEWLRGLIFADGAVSEEERAFVIRLRAEARDSGTVLKQLCQEVKNVEQADMWG